MAYNGGMGNVDKGTVSTAAQNYANDLLLALMIVDQSNNYEYFCNKYKTSKNIIKRFKNIPENYENLKNKKFF